MMERLDHRIGSATPRFGRESRDEARGKTADRGYEDQEPRAERSAGVDMAWLPVGEKRYVPGRTLEHHSLDELEEQTERGTKATRGGADQRRVQEDSPEKPEVERT
jgi:hypothetical protein